MSVKGIDISANNGRNIDFVAVYASGVRFVFIKMTEGTYVNPYAVDHARAARAAGLLVGGYCFVHPLAGRTGGAEVGLFLDTLRAAGLHKKGSLRPTADIEIAGDLPAGKPARRYHYEFLERLARHIPAGSFGSFDRRPFVYTGSWFWDGVLGALNGHRCPLWLAAYTTGWRRFVPRAFRKGASIHQYSAKGRVPGVSGDCDLNTYFGRNVQVLRRRHVLRHDIGS